MLDACVKCGNLEKAVEVFRGMRALVALGVVSNHRLGLKDKRQETQALVEFDWIYRT